jgi:hypothetical protein
MSASLLFSDRYLAIATSLKGRVGTVIPGDCVSTGRLSAIRVRLPLGDVMVALISSHNAGLCNR